MGSEMPNLQQILYAMDYTVLHHFAFKMTMWQFMAPFYYSYYNTK